MKPIAPILTFWGLLCLLSLTARSQAFEPKPNSRIVLLGNTFADRMRHYGYFETLLQKYFHGRRITLRNMGWSADEVGLQPRPLNFPGFRNSEAQVSEVSKEVSFKRYKFEGEKIVMPVPLNFEGLHQDLFEQKADIIFLCFGMNESFNGGAGLAVFEKDLQLFIDQLLSKKYNGTSPPQLVLVSPIAHEAMGGELPDPTQHNQNLRGYSESMKRIADSGKLRFLDLFTPSYAAMQHPHDVKLTINGIHLTDAGYAQAARWMASELGISRKHVGMNFNSRNARRLREVIKMKDDHFFYRWRAVNGEYIYGRRREPFGVLSFPPELRKLRAMAASLDTVIWKLAKGSGEDGYKRAREIVDERGKSAALSNLPDVVMTGRQGASHAMGQHAHAQKSWPVTTEQFTLPEGYAINLFASEKNFPVEKPVAMNFDARGRLWVATMPTYPQYYPGIPVHDRIVILEDTNADGVADKHTVFADNLYLPLGFEFHNGGVIVSQEPDLIFLKDTDGDDKADVREVLLTGFGSEDSHHATHAFTYGQDGALYFNEGTFLNSQIETPYGPVRSYSGTTYRFEPRSWKLSAYISYPYYNPWGSVFDKWGTHLIGDASDGSNYFAPPMTGKLDYPAKHPRMNMFTETKVRPTAGIEIVSSGQFPDQVQGDFLVNNNIGFQGTKQFRVVADGSGIKGKEGPALLQSSDPNFRPIDLKFGPDGALYVVDWYNPLVSHGENPPRDPMRDKRHGRIWRITHNDRPVLTNIDISKLGVFALLENLKVPEDRHRYRVRARLRESKADQVLPEVLRWISGLDRTNPDFELYLMEALWLYQDFNRPAPDLLKDLLVARDERARAAATRVLLQWRDKVPDATALMKRQINDPSPRVRLEAVVAFSHFSGDEAVLAATDIFKYPTDYYLDYAIKETFNYLKPVWLRVFRNQPDHFSNNPKAAEYLISSLNDGELISLPQTPLVRNQIVIHRGATQKLKEVTLHSLAKEGKKKPVDLLLEIIHRQSERYDTFESFSGRENDLIGLLLSFDQKELLDSKTEILKFLDKGQNNLMQAVAYATVITMDGSDKTARKFADRNAQNKTNYLRGVSQLSEVALQGIFYNEVKELAVQNASDSLGRLAYRVLVQMNGHDLEKMKMIGRLLTPGDPNADLAVEMISALEKKKNISVSFAREIVPQLLTYVRQDESDTSKVGNLRQFIVLGTKLARTLPEAEAVPALAAFKELGILEVKLSALPAKMLFDLDTISVRQGRLVSLTFENRDLMPHNVVIVQKGSAQKVGEAADAMAKQPDGFERHFVPRIPEVLFSTPLIEGGKSFNLNFTAPEQSGDYPFICSFPGHWQVMKGILKVK
jgi:azurin